MRVLGKVAVPVFAVVLVGVGCNNKSAATTIDAAPVAPVISEANPTAATIRQFYPLACSTNDAWSKWATCHDTTKGFEQILACATTARGEANVVQLRLPVAKASTSALSCSAVIEAKSRLLVNGMARYFQDLVAWLTAHRASLRGPLAASSLQDLDSDKLKEGMPEEWDRKYKGTDPNDAMLGFGMVNMLTCTKSIFRCGTENASVECGVAGAAIRLGVACGTSSPFHHVDGTQYCPSGICNLNDPRAWLYDLATNERVP